VTTIAAARIALSELERAARQAWLEWASYRGYHVCAGCGEPRYCGRARPSGDWLCVCCFDLGGAS
jgi:formylmethanofuran dehydrogenase subunit E